MRTFFTKRKKKSMKSLEPWLNRTVLRTVAGFCGSYGSVLKQIYSLKRHSAGIYTDQKTDINRERIWKAKNRKKKKWKERRNREKKKKKKKPHYQCGSWQRFAFDRSILIFSFYFFRLLKNVFYFFSVPSFHLLFFLWAAFTSFPFASFLVSLPCLLAFRFVMDS